MGDDEYHPISRKGTNLTKAGGIGYTVVDSIDTMLIMGLDEEHQRARDWVANKMVFDRDADFNTFEVRLPFRNGSWVNGLKLIADDNSCSWGPSFSLLFIWTGPSLS